MRVRLTIEQLTCKLIAPIEFLFSPEWPSRCSWPPERMRLKVEQTNRRQLQNLHRSIPSPAARKRQQQKRTKTSIELHAMEQTVHSDSGIKSPRRVTFNRHAFTQDRTTVIYKESAKKSQSRRSRQSNWNRLGKMDSNPSFLVQQRAVSVVSIWPVHSVGLPLTVLLELSSFQLHQLRTTKEDSNSVKTFAFVSNKIR